uniref:Zinc finger protein 585B-like isoform X1 n=2 Tax=Diabrotica virgifera virgifera TaxID=50390 RepID=A0A6P7GPK9_DIAVI
MMPKIIKMEDDMDDIFDEEVEKSMEIKALLPIKQETPFYPEDTALSINISHTNENILNIKSEKVYEEIIDNFEIKLEELDELKIEPEDIKQIWRNKNIKSQKKKYYICVICQKKFPSARRRNNHLRIHFDIPVKTKSGKSRSSNEFFGKQIFVCGFCGQLHINKTQILSHCQQYYVKSRRNIGYNRTQSNSALNDIDVFKSKVKLKTEVDNSDRHLLGCRLSSSKISNKNSFASPIRYYRTCGRCGKSVTSKPELHQHYQTHEKYKCKICAKEYRVKKNLMIHMLNHKEDYKTFELNQNSKRCVICHICSKFFATEHALRYHLISHTGERKYDCKHCLKSYKYEQDLNRHMHSHTGGEIKLFECHHCYKVFKQKGHLNRHIEGHVSLGSKNYKCDMCTRSYQRKESLYVHIRTVHNGVRYFRSHNNEYVRKESENEKCYICYLCNKSCTRKTDLRKHIARCTRKKLMMQDKQDPFECKQCDKKFLYKNMLVRHIKDHESRRYICNLCSKSYNRIKCFKNHICTVKHECKHCGKVFKYRSNLCRHVQGAHEGKRYICALCNKSYIQKDDLIAHFERVHKDQKLEHL